MTYSPVYTERVRELNRWKKPALVDRCAELGHYGFTHGRNGLAGWNKEELLAEILRSEFPEGAQQCLTHER
jgi:hypothetical protein